MSAPQEGYPPQGYPQQDPYGQQAQYGEQQPQPGFGDTTTSPPPPGEQHHDIHGKKKKRGYAAQAYDFGAGGNVPLGNAPPSDAFSPLGTPAYGGYAAPVPAPAYSGNQPYVESPPAASTFGQSALGGLGGYQPPEPAYPGPGAAMGGVGGITQGMGQMGFGQQQAQPGAPAAAKIPLNQLYPTDLLNQPFNVAELELPPPPIILPPNVS